MIRGWFGSWDGRLNDILVDAALAALLAAGITGALRFLIENL